MRCRPSPEPAPKPRPAFTGRPPARRRVCLLFTVSCVFARPAAAECGAALDTHLREATIDTIQWTLRTLDRDATRHRNAYGSGAMRHNVTGVGGIAPSHRRLCVPGRDTFQADDQVLGAVGQTGFGGWRVRALALAAKVEAGSWDGDIEQPSHGHRVYGGFIGYDRLLELGLVHFEPGPTSALSAGGWLLSAASHGVRLTFALDRDRFEDVDVAVGPIHVGPLAVGGGGRWLHEEDIYTGYLAATDILLAGQWDGGIFVDTQAELELNTGLLRSAWATLRLTFDVAPMANMPPDQRRSDLPVDTLRVHGDLRVMASVYGGSRLPDGGMVPGGGMGWEIGMYGRHAGFTVSALGWMNAPAALDHSEDPYEAMRFELIGRLVVGGSNTPRSPARPMAWSRRAPPEGEPPPLP